MIEGMQLIVYYPVLRVDAPANIGLFQVITTSCYADHGFV